MKYFLLLLLTGGMALLLPTAQASASVNLTQDVVDLNGGSLEINDILEYTITIENTSGQTASGITLTNATPLGAQLVSGSVTSSSGSVNVVDDEIQFTKPSMTDGEIATITFQMQVDGSPIYFVNSANPPKLYTLDRATGAATFVTDFTGQTGVYGLGVTPDARYVYGVNSSTDTVFYYDVIEDTMHTVGSLNLGRNVGVPCLDFNPDGELYGADSKKDTLFRIDLETGQATETVALGVDIRGGDCAFSASGDLYVMSNTNNGKGALWVVDPATGAAKHVANVSDTEFFTGVALGVDGNLYGSGTSTDSLFQIDPATGVGTSQGSFGIGHGGGDLAMTASQQLNIVNTAIYHDDNPTDDESVSITTSTGTNPPVGNEDDTRNKDPFVDDTAMCIYGSDPETCQLPSNFQAKMDYYIEDVVTHHFLQVEAVAGDEVERRNLDGDDAANYYDSAYNVINPARTAAKNEADQMVTDWMAAHNGAAGYCPHEHQLMMNIREMLSLRQAQANIGVMGIGESGVAKCSVVAQDTLIRYGDKVVVAWATQNSSGGNISPFIGGVGQEGTVRIHPLETNTYTFDAGGATCEVEILVEAACDIGFHSDVMEEGAGMTMLWNGEGAQVVEVSTLGGVAITGEQVVNPSSTTTYTLTSSSDGAQVRQCSRTLTVVPAGSIPMCAQ